MKKILMVAAVLVAACGGGDSESDRLLQAATDQDIRARQLATLEPCQEDSQCVYAFLRTTDPMGCAFPPRLLYSTASANVAALEAAVDARNQLVADYLRSIPKPAFACGPLPSCTAIVKSCRASRCVEDISPSPNCVVR